MPLLGVRVYVDCCAKASVKKKILITFLFNLLFNTCIV